MRRFNQEDLPQILIDNWKQIGDNYSQRRIVNPGYAFSWPQINNIKINHLILRGLQRQTQEHCSYCDNYPPKIGDETIDHFKPKTVPAFYNLVANWENLYLACKHCQEAKGTQYSEELLRPDAPDYNFSDYFIYDFDEHKLTPNPIAAPENQNRAQMTFNIFQLNHTGLSKTRKRNLACYRSGEFKEDELGFRFIYQFF